MSRVLFLSRWLPYPATNGSKLRIYNLLRALVPFHEVTLVSFRDEADPQVVAPALGALCQQVRTVPWKPFEAGSSRARAGFFRLTPRSFLDTFSGEMKHTIVDTLAAREYDVVIASQIDMAVYREAFGAVPAIFEEAEVATLYEQFARAGSIWLRARYGLTWLKFRSYLRRLMRRFQLCTVASEREKQLLDDTVPGYRGVEVIPNCINLADYQSIRKVVEPNTLIFTGALTYRPNYEAMVWFLSDVYPRIQAQVPGVHLVITGEHASLPLPPADNVTRAGFVGDVRPLLAGSAVSLAPIWSGGGTRLKILEAMALHTPVVATFKGAEGLAVRDREHLLLADTPQDFARSVVRLLHDEKMGQSLVEDAYRLLRDQYSLDAVMPRFRALVERVAVR